MRKIFSEGIFSNSIPNLLLPILCPNILCSFNQICLFSSSFPPDLKIVIFLLCNPLHSGVQLSFLSFIFPDYELFCWCFRSLLQVAPFDQVTGVESSRGDYGFVLDIEPSCSTICSFWFNPPLLTGRIPFFLTRSFPPPFSTRTLVRINARSQRKGAFPTVKSFVVSFFLDPTVVAFLISSPTTPVDMNLLSLRLPHPLLATNLVHVVAPFSSRWTHSFGPKNAYFPISSSCTGFFFSRLFH